MISEELEDWANGWYEYTFNDFPQCKEMNELKEIIKKIKTLEKGTNRG